MSLVSTKKMKPGSSLARALFKGALAVLFLMVSVLQVQAQNRTISGTVVDNMGEPLPGAYVIVPNTTNGVIANADGKFSISVPEGTVLRFSFTGLTAQEITVGSQTEINVVLTEDATQLDNVVAVGYGTAKVKDLTGAATAVSVAQIPDFPAASLVEALAGQVVGLSVDRPNGGYRPGATGSFQIRQPMQFETADAGLNSAFSQPLIVIDGVVQVDMNGNPTMTTFNMLDRSEIESFTLLKDASAAVYGSRASSGVILIETKRGTAGQAKISYNGRIDYADAVSHPKYMNAYETGAYTNLLIDQAYRINPSGNDQTSYKYSDEELNHLRGINYDWLDEAWNPAVSHRHSLTVDGGSQTATFFAGVNYQDQATNLGSKQDYSKWSFRAGGNIQVAANLKLSASVSGYTDKQVKGKEQGMKGDYARLLKMPKYIPWEWEYEGERHFVSPFQGPMGINTSNDAGIKSGDNDAVANYFANEASTSKAVNDDNGWSANFSLRYDVPFIKGLSLNATYSKTHTNSSKEEAGGYYYLIRATNTHEAGKHLIGAHTTWNTLNFGDPYGDNIDNKPQVNYTKSNSQSEQINFQVNYARTFGDHEISATGVVERAESSGSEMKQLFRGVGLVYNGSSTTAGKVDEKGTGITNLIYESGALSYIGRFHYKYSDRYIFDFVIRTDASTKFAPENYWGTFPTASAGWVISEESFFKNSKMSNIFQFLKLRYSLGKTGKDNIAAWSWLINYNIAPDSGWGFGTTGGGRPTNGAILNGSPNRDITWDSTIKQNIGLDLTVLSNRLSITTDFYYDKTKDMILNLFYAEEPIYIGKPVPKINFGKQEAWGWEFSARWSDTIETGSSWGPIRYGIGADYGISWRKVTQGGNFRFDYPATTEGEKTATGWRSPGSEWGYKTWKHTSGGDGMLRTQEDIDNYWAYLKANADASNTTPQYFSATSKERLYLGMIALEDSGGSKNVADRTFAGPDGRIMDSTDRAADYQKLGSQRTHNINSRFNLSWGNFTWSTQLSTSWGGVRYLDNGVNMTISRSAFINSSYVFMNDMFDPETNPHGKWPSAIVGNITETSDFWQLPTFRMYVRNMTFGYNVPKKLLTKINVDAVRLSLTGNNLWDFYNPYPDKYRNMYDGGTVNYPTLRTWTFGLNVTF